MRKKIFPLNKRFKNHDYRFYISLYDKNDVKNTAIRLKKRGSISHYRIITVTIFNFIYMKSEIKYDLYVRNYVYVEPPGVNNF